MRCNHLILKGNAVPLMIIYTNSKKGLQLLVSSVRFSMCVIHVCAILMDFNSTNYISKNYCF